jgi:hypothetical protein
MLGQMLLFLAWGGLPYFVWGFVVRVLFTMHMTWCVKKWRRVPQSMHTLLLKTVFVKCQRSCACCSPCT